MKMQDKNFGIYHDLTIDASIEKVFAAVTQPKHLVNWWPLKCTGKPEIGAKYNFYFTPEYDWFGKVNEIVLNQTFSVKMTKSDLDWDGTRLGFEMNIENGKTYLRFTHLDWPEFNAHYRIASFCWAMLLKGLKDYLEKGTILPFEERS